MPAGKLIYKCRGCKTRYAGARVADISTALSEAAANGNGVSPMRLSLLDFHVCDNPGVTFGVADLIGALEES